MEDARDFTEVNRKYWDQAAATYSSKPWQLKMQQQILEEVRLKHEFIGLSARDDESAGRKKLLDYACGTGLVSRALAPYITSTTGIDLSDSMVAKFNEALSSPEAGIRGHAIIGNLLVDPSSGDLASPELYDFDIAAIGLGFHHFANPEGAIERLVQRVKPKTGIVLIIDWLPDPAGHHHGQGHGHRQHDHDRAHEHHHDHGKADKEFFQTQAVKTIKTHGFSEEDMRRHFGAAGCTDFGFSVMAEPVELWMGEGETATCRRKTVFLARGTRT